MNQTALLVVDVQQSFEQRPYWTERDLPAFQEALITLMEGCLAKQVPIVRILHVDPEGAFSLASGWVKPMRWVPAAHDIEFQKNVHNSFTGTGLDYWLRRRGVNRILVTGIRTEQCCETTARVGCDLGYDVDFVTEATLTFDTRAPSGRPVTASELKERTEVVLHGRFATVRTVRECLASL